MKNVKIVDLWLSQTIHDQVCHELAFLYQHLYIHHEVLSILSHEDEHRVIYDIVSLLSEII